ncbi:TonB family protein [Halobacteriovorax sp. HLS]|uniref:TonB family protein n=1 Tax=Halobacteriovorax sp. HLS TaxID=2234000 RepID=UPI000FDC6E92|nr:TonB family protein [Halobacteriovorax sp. HLS]
MITKTLENKSFKYYFSWSFFFHVSLFLLFLLIGKLFHDQINATKDFNMKLVESSVRVDVVAMPKMTLKELKALPQISKGSETAVIEKKEVVKEVIEKDDVVLEKKVKKASFLDMMKDLSNKEVKKTKQVKKKEKKGSRNGLNIDSNTLKNLVAEGNRVSKGVAISGTGSANVDMTGFTAYMSSLPSHVRVHWKLPGYLLGRDLQCRIRIFIKENGTLLKAEIYESSGEKEFDERALKAVQLSSPFPTVPAENKLNALNGEIVLGFPL